LFAVWIKEVSSDMNEREKNAQRCKRLLDRLLSALNLEFREPWPDMEDGWYVWRNSPDWPIDSYAVFEVIDGMMHEPEPADSYGAVWEMGENKAYGELAGPIIGC